MLSKHLGYGVVGLVGIYVLIKFLFNSHKQKLIKKSNLPVITNFEILSEEDEYKHLQELHKKHGYCFINSFHFLDILVVSHPDIVKQVLKEEKTIQKSFFVANKNFKKLLDLNILGANGEDWERHKSTFKKPFDFEAIEGYHPTFVKVANKLIQKLKKDDLEQEVDVSHHSTGYAVFLFSFLFSFFFFFSFFSFFFFFFFSFFFLFFFFFLFSFLILSFSTTQ